MQWINSTFGGGGGGYGNHQMFRKHLFLVMYSKLPCGIISYVKNKYSKQANTYLHHISVLLAVLRTPPEMSLDARDPGHEGLCRRLPSRGPQVLLECFGTVPHVERVSTVDGTACKHTR